MTITARVTVTEEEVFLLLRGGENVEFEDDRQAVYDGALNRMKVAIDRAREEADRDLSSPVLSGLDRTTSGAIGQP